MPLPEPIKSFFYAYESLAKNVTRTPWGLAVTDPRFPSVYDANKAQVLEAAPELTLREMQEVLAPMLEADGIEFEHVEFMCLADPMRAVAQAQAASGRTRPDAVMAFQADDVPRPHTEALITEITDPDDAFWRYWMDSRLEFGTAMSVSVLDQLLDRDRSVYWPAGMRIFAGFLDDRLAGFCSLLSMQGAGYIDSVVTLPDARRKGVASRTVCAAVAASRLVRDRATFLMAELGGRPHRLYERLGFRTISRAVGFTRPRLRSVDDRYL
jgi:ribosomal protein S18 acetylase RimI-like enzyme